MNNCGLNIRRLSGLDLKPSHWDNFYQFYMNTCQNKWGRPYLTQDFFHELGYSMAGHVMLAVAQEGNESSPLVAAALNLVCHYLIDMEKNLICSPSASPQTWQQYMK